MSDLELARVRQERDEYIVRIAELTAQVDQLKREIGAVAQPKADGDVDGLDMDGFAAFFDRKASWSADTFGPGDRYTGVTKHIEKELAEVRAKPSDLIEWVDIALLAMDGAWRSAGATGRSFVQAMVDKHKVNMSRPWPDWRTAPEGEVVEHIRSEE